MKDNKKDILFILGGLLIVLSTIIGGIKALNIHLDRNKDIKEINKAGTIINEALNKKETNISEPGLSIEDLKKQYEETKQDIEKAKDDAMEIRDSITDLYEPIIGSEDQSDEDDISQNDIDPLEDLEMTAISVPNESIIKAINEKANKEILETLGLSTIGIILGLGLIIIGKRK
jgi:septal ring factor EnvC (AmiA/AmiB activator)